MARVYANGVAGRHHAKNSKNGAAHTSRVETHRAVTMALAPPAQHSESAIAPMSINASTDSTSGLSSDDMPQIQIHC